MALHLVSNKPAVIGVLDLQGGVHEHLDHLERLGVAHKRVKQISDFSDLAGLIIPGGESTCMARLLDIFNIKEVIRRHYARGMKLWGTCAGAVLLAREVVGENSCLDLIDMKIERNSFGSQLDSFVSEALIPAVCAESIPLTFIRAPKIIAVGKEINVLLKMDNYIAAAESENVLVTVFHPELTGCLALHRYFAIKCELKLAANGHGYIDPLWKISSWTRHAGIA